MKCEQLSIYDFIGEENNFLPEEKSQEVAPSETLPQVDEAQEINPLYMRCTGEIPSSALVTFKPEMRELTPDELENGVGISPKIPTEDTDKSLFSVGDLITVRKAEEVYLKGVSYEGYGVCTPEDYYHLKEFETQQGIVTFYDGKSYKCKMFKGNKLVGFYPNELK